MNDEVRVDMNPRKEFEKTNKRLDYTEEATPGYMRNKFGEKIKHAPRSEFAGTRSEFE